MTLELLGGVLRKACIGSAVLAVLFMLLHVRVSLLVIEDHTYVKTKGFFNTALVHHHGCQCMER